MGLLNSHFVLEQADLLAKRLHDDADSDTARIQLAWKLCFGRMPDPDELESAQLMIKDVGWNQLTRALLNAIREDFPTLLSSDIADSVTPVVQLAMH